jgi:hypothetical protein
MVDGDLVVAAAQVLDDGASGGSQTLLVAVPVTSIDR